MTSTEVSFDCNVFLGLGWWTLTEISAIRTHLGDEHFAFLNRMEGVMGLSSFAEAHYRSRKWVA